MNRHETRSEILEANVPLNDIATGASEDARRGQKRIYGDFCNSSQPEGEDLIRFRDAESRELIPEGLAREISQNAS